MQFDMTESTARFFVFIAVVAAAATRSSSQYYNQPVHVRKTDQQSVKGSACFLRRPHSQVSQEFISMITPYITRPAFCPLLWLNRPPPPPPTPIRKKSQSQQVSFVYTHYVAVLSTFVLDGGWRDKELGLYLVRTLRILKLPDPATFPVRSCSFLCSHPVVPASSLTHGGLKELYLWLVPKRSPVTNCFKLFDLSIALSLKAFVTQLSRWLHQSDANLERFNLLWDGSRVFTVMVLLALLLLFLLQQLLCGENPCSNSLFISIDQS